MDQTFHESIEVEPEKLLEQFWFFSNVMSKNSSGELYQETFKLTEKGYGDDIDGDDKLNPKNEEDSEDEELESEITMGSLIRQASLSNPEICFPPRKSRSRSLDYKQQGLTARSRITKWELCASRVPEKVGGSQGPMSQQKSLHDLEELYKLELHVFKDLGVGSEAQTSVDRATKDIKAHIKFWARAVASNVQE